MVKAGRSSGTVTITVTALETDHYKTTSKTIKVRVPKKDNIRQTEEKNLFLQWQGT